MFVCEMFILVRSQPILSIIELTVLESLDNSTIQFPLPSTDHYYFFFLSFIYCTPPHYSLIITSIVSCNRMKFSRIPVVFLVAFFFILLFFTQGNEESNEMVAVSANLTDAQGKADHDCEKSSSSSIDKYCSREGGQTNISGSSDSEESVFENEDYIYTQSLNP